MARSVPLSIEDIRSVLATKSLGHSLYLHQELSSTNKEALALAQSGASHGTVVIAECQSAGRGRHGRMWFSPSGQNIYCSILVRGMGQKIALAEWLSWLPLVSALAVAESIFHVTSVRLALKWPNDLLLDERKAGGILCESTLSSHLDPVVVIGIGLNVNVEPESFPTDLRPIAASLREVVSGSINRNMIIPQLLLELENGLDELQTHGATRLRHAYSERCVTLGRRVRALSAQGLETIGTAEAIAADGTLQIRPLTSFPSTRLPSLIDVRAADVIHLRE
jgi:BirA family transcriptional regulator, biotin operon repressor / biotin---[acetyl-CoA-carboxylase] ligase